MSRLGFVLLAFALAACSQSPPPVAQLPPPPAGPPQGIDLPNDARDVSNELKSSHVDFVARYYRDPASRWPALSSAEAAMLSAQGFKIVAIWESHSRRPDYFSYASGFADAINAYREAKSVGQPPGSAIYFAVDYNAQAPDIYGPIDHYFRGVANGLASVGAFNQYKIGAYGSGAVCAYLKSMRLAQYAWLSNSIAWTGYDSFGAWNIRQLTTFPFLSFSHDRNEATNDYGGFQVTNQYSSL
jgi:glycoside hydrolase-like protein